MVSALRFAPPPFSLRQFTPSHLLPPPTFQSSIRPPPLRIGIHLSARYRSSSSSDPSDGGGGSTFDGAVSLFNGGDYHQCHDELEDLWNGAEEPVRTILHGILQCSVGFHHLFNQNHRGAMMELGEGVCKLRKVGFESGPLLMFEKEVSEVLEFVYQTQMELAACTDDMCVAMDGSDRSYQLLGSFASGQHLYSVDISSGGIPYIVFCPAHQKASDKSPRVRVPILTATEELLKSSEYLC